MTTVAVAAPTAPSAAIERQVHPDVDDHHRRREREVQRASIARDEEVQHAAVHEHQRNGRRQRPQRGDGAAEIPPEQQRDDWLGGERQRPAEQEPAASSKIPVIARSVRTSAARESWYPRASCGNVAVISSTGSCFTTSTS